ncbi:hypothetical protein T440DRAFT_460074 [Plenodomus tracheiphilus IPT5]|uniref:Metallo-beta-lactamase domain-containing protein n=1 Tax=Plenodomus tracheiphilus IPT5 TaxID=1408161 RepID=A0A6A7AQR9_9PLEO|nr:hypothetical protein T440DRAFT_460074 [Plenodomus tracheiphilus IPT5]
MCTTLYACTESQSNSAMCPFSIRQVNNTTYLIRERDEFGEFPHIYVKKCSQTDAAGRHTSVLLINDTGVGTSAARCLKHPPWNINSFIEHHLNPNGDIPYLVLLSHCHYDHILGLNSLLQSQNEIGAQADTPSQVQIASSAHGRLFTTPYTNLQEHSLCNNLGCSAPKYQTSKWAADHAPIVYSHPSGVTMSLPIITMHTPGHTPDSLSWLDVEEQTLYVGDSFYEQQSEDSRNAPWGPEDPASILFTKESDLSDWWQSLNRLIDFVKRSGEEFGQPVKLAAGHVTAEVNALEFLAQIKHFMMKVLTDKLTFARQPDKRGEAFGHWSDQTNERFSLGAPLRVVEDGRRRILEEGSFRMHVATYLVDVWPSSRLYLTFNYRN